MKIYIAAHSQAEIIVTSDDSSIERDLSNYLEFLVPGHQYMPAFKRGMWNGKIKLYNRITQLVYRGLLPRVLKFAQERNLEVHMDKDVYVPNDYSIDDLKHFIKSLKLPDEIVPRDYQLKSALECINKKRLTVLSPTGSGKSLIIYLVTMFIGMKTLIIVPTKNLVHQMVGDFGQYNYKGYVHSIYSGKDKDTDADISVTTWQSLTRMPKTWFDQFGCVFVDETHQAKAKSITAILEKMDQCEYRFGTTGTLDGEKTHRYIIEGLLGSVFRMVTTKELMNDGVLADLTVNAIILKHSDEICTLAQEWDYKKEIDYIIGCPARNQFIVDTVLSKKGNNLVVFNFVEKHGHILEKLFSEQTDRPIYYIHGGIDATIRDDMRAKIEQEDDAIIIAGLKAFATGTNIKKLNNIFFTHPSKSRITTLQAIGRVLRTSKYKIVANLYDIVDDMKPKDWGKMNFTLRHFVERLKIYKAEKFHYTVDQIALETYVGRKRISS